jgi:HEAT repeat protein
MHRSNVKLARFAVPPLADALRDPQEDVRFAAAKALKAIGAAARDAAPELIDVLDDDAPKVRRAAAGAVVWLVPPDEGVPVLVPILADEDTTVRWAAARALGNYGSHAVSDLIAVLGDDDPVLRAGAAEALGQIGPAASAARPSLETARADQDANVSRAATAALDKVAPGSGL